MLCHGRSKELTAKFAKKTEKSAKMPIGTLFFASSAGALRELCDDDFSSPADQRPHRGV
jgi:hypothetical protein